MSDVLQYDDMTGQDWTEEQAEAESRTQLSYPLNNTWYTAKFPQSWMFSRTNGIFSSDNDLICTPIGGMRVNISTGRAWLNPGSVNSTLQQLDLRNCCYTNAENAEFELEIADGLLTRIDRIVVRWDFVLNSVFLDLKQGILASNPQPPALQRDMEAFELGLHDIRVAPRTITLNSGMISDLRLNEELCGIMRDGVTGIPTQALFDQWYEWFSHLQLDAQSKGNEFIVWANLFMIEQPQLFAQWMMNFQFTSEQEMREFQAAFQQISTSW